MITPTQSIVQTKSKPTNYQRAVRAVKALSDREFATLCADGLPQLMAARRRHARVVDLASARRRRDGLAS